MKRLTSLIVGQEEWNGVKETCGHLGRAVEKQI